MDRPVDEGLLTANRISELEECPFVGRFDAAHLCEIHRRIFQDLPHHRPGQFRREASAWVKARELESGETYYVPYAPRRILESRLAHVLNNIHGPSGFDRRKDCPGDSTIERGGCCDLRVLPGRRGKHIGRPRGIDPKKQARMTRILPLFQSGSVSWRQAAQQAGVALSTLQRYVHTHSS